MEAAGSELVYHELLGNRYIMQTPQQMVLHLKVITMLMLHEKRLSELEHDVKEKRSQSCQNEK